MQRSKVAENKLLATVLIVLGAFGFLTILHRLCCYRFEYDAEFSPVDYGRFNILSFFTIQSNIFVYIYLICAGLAAFGVKGAEKVGHDPLIGALATTYILVTGVVYTAGIPMGFTPPFEWYDAYHAMSSFNQVFYHMIIPPVMLVLWFFPFTDRTAGRGRLWIFTVYPLVYSLFSIVRGAVGNMHFYPYPFYRPEFIWELFGGGSEMNAAGAYALMALVLAAGMLLFAGIGRLMIFINEKSVARSFALPEYVREAKACGSGAAAPGGRI